jgi:hypothetical protein
VAGTVEGRVKIEYVDGVELLFELDVSLVELLEHRYRMSGHKLTRLHQHCGLALGDQSEVEDVAPRDAVAPVPNRFRDDFHRRLHAYLMPKNGLDFKPWRGQVWRGHEVDLAFR